MSFRKIIFWIHLVAGVAAGVVIAIMSFTGAVLAFEKEIIAWAERDVRKVATPSSGALSMAELLERLKEKKPNDRPSAITVFADPQNAILVSFGRTNAAYLNPHTGEIREPTATGLRSFMQVMIEWHRWIGLSGERRTMAKAITGASNLVFFFLAVSGLYLWFPRKWTSAALRSIALMSFKLSGRARDWNWHNAIGFWSASVLIVLTATALPISYRWAGNLIYKLTGTEAPAQGGGGGAPLAEVPVTKPSPDAKRLEYDALLAAVQKEMPDWDQITFRLGSRAPRAGRRGEESAGASESRPTNGERRSSDSGTTAVTMTVKERGGWPLFASTQITVYPFTGAILQKESFQNYNLGRKVRSWTRFLHTGEALGTVGKALAGLASLGGVFLVYTGFALALRRFVRWKKTSRALPLRQEAALVDSP